MFVYIGEIHHFCSVHWKQFLGFVEGTMFFTESTMGFITIFHHHLWNKMYFVYSPYEQIKEMAGVGEIAYVRLFLKNPSRIEWDRIPKDPVQ